MELFLILYIVLIGLVQTQYVTIWYDDMSTAGSWNIGGASVLLSLQATSCQNAGYCARTVADNGDSWIYRSINTANYSYIRLQFYVHARNIETFEGDQCEVKYFYSDISNDGTNETAYTMLQTYTDTSRAFFNQTFDLPPTNTILWIRFETHGNDNGGNDRCFWDTISLFGILKTFHPTINPTFYPTTNPTLYPSTNPTLDPTTNPTLDPSINPTESSTKAEGGVIASETTDTKSELDDSNSGQKQSQILVYIMMTGVVVGCCLFLIIGVLHRRRKNKDEYTQKSMEMHAKSEDKNVKIDVDQREGNESDLNHLNRKPNVQTLITPSGNNDELVEYDVVMETGQHSEMVNTTGDAEKSEDISLENETDEFVITDDDIITKGHNNNVVPDAYAFVVKEDTIQ